MTVRVCLICEVLGSNNNDRFDCDAPSGVVAGQTEVGRVDCLQAELELSEVVQRKRRERGRVYPVNSRNMTPGN